MNEVMIEMWKVAHWLCLIIIQLCTEKMQELKSIWKWQLWNIQHISHKFGVWKPTSPQCQQSGKNKPSDVITRRRSVRQRSNVWLTDQNFDKNDPSDCIVFRQEWAMADALEYGSFLSEYCPASQTFGFRWALASRCNRRCYSWQTFDPRRNESLDFSSLAYHWPPFTANVIRWFSIPKIWERTLSDNALKLTMKVALAP